MIVFKMEDGNTLDIDGVLVEMTEKYYIVYGENNKLLKTINADMVKNFYWEKRGDK